VNVVSCRNSDCQFSSVASQNSYQNYPDQKAAAWSWSCCSFLNANHWTTSWATQLERKSPRKKSPSERSRTQALTPPPELAASASAPHELVLPHLGCALHASSPRLFAELLDGLVLKCLLLRAHSSRLPSGWCGGSFPRGRRRNATTSRWRRALVRSATAATPTSPRTASRFAADDASACPEAFGHRQTDAPFVLDTGRSARPPRQAPPSARQAPPI
jgi:hypothetical protein